jgi:putative ABC transport system permease protein
MEKINSSQQSSSSEQHALHPPDHTDHSLLLHPDELLAPRWKKMLGDLWGNKVRTLLVVMSIFIGVFAVGIIAGSQAVLSRELRQEYRAVRPAHATISTGGTMGYNEDYTIDFRPANDQGFTEDLVEVVRNMEEVSAAEGRRTFNVRVHVGNTWKSMNLIAIDDFHDMRVDIVRRVSGMWPPPKREVVIERSGMAMLNAQVGESIVIERPDGKQRTLRIAGVAHDLTEWPTPFLSTFYGYITFDTMEWLGEPHNYSTMLVRFAGNASNQEHNKIAAREVYDKVQKAGLDPSFPKVPRPDEPPLDFLIAAIIGIMGLLGIFAVLLSGFLVTNTIAALLAQQIKQIGMMKAVGARPTQIMSIYITLVICFGLIALIPAIPLAQAATDIFSSSIGEFLNFDIHNTNVPLYVIGLQVAISIAVPVIAALIPIRSGTSITIREALSSEGVPQSYGTGLLDRLLQSVRGLPRPVLLSLRNTFRRKARVMLTLITLTLAGAFFISVFSIKGSLEQTIEEMITSLYNYDIEVYLNHSYRADNVINEALNVPGVVAAEPMAIAKARRVFTTDKNSQNILPDDREGTDMQIFGVPPDTQTMHPPILEGRWLLPGDDNALVISVGMLKEDSDIQIGDEIVLNIEDKKTTWRVVGILKAIGESRWAYAPYDHYAHITREVGQTSYVRIVTSQHSGEFQTQTANRLEDHFQSQSIDVSSTKTMHEMSEGDKATIEVITMSLLFIALLVAIVGSLGLAGTMSLNVIERTREIGIMRAIGASDVAILQVFMIEGMLLGLISWCLGALISLPVSKGMSHAMGMMLLSSPLSFSPSGNGIIVWFVLSLVLAAVASFLPAWKATHVTVRDVLAYE